MPRKQTVKKYKYNCYESVRKGLSKDGIPHSGIVATILLETFLVRGGELKAAHVTIKNTTDKMVCGTGKGDFKAWRKRLEDKGWIKWESSGSFATHYCGDKLAEYVNRERSKTKEFATTEHIQKLSAQLDTKADKVNVEQLVARIDKLESMVSVIAEDYLKRNPPNTPERVKLFKENLSKGIPFIESDRTHLHLVPLM